MAANLGKCANWDLILASATGERAPKVHSASNFGVVIVDMAATSVELEAAVAMCGEEVPNPSIRMFFVPVAAGTTLTHP